MKQVDILRQLEVLATVSEISELKKRFSFQFKLISFYLISTGVVLIFIAFFLSLTIKSYLIEQIRDRMNKEADLIKNVIERRYPHGIATQEVDASAKEFGKSLHLRITLIDLQGKVWGDSDVLPRKIASMENHSDRPEIQQALLTGKGESIHYSKTLTTSMLYIARLVSYEGKKLGVVRLALPLIEVDHTISKIYQFISFATLVTLVIAIILIVLTSVWISRPISELAQTARKMASGNFMIKTKEQSTEELRELAEAFNTLTAELKEKIAQANLEKSQLEAVLSGMLEGVMVTDEKGRVTMVNKAMESIFSIKGSVMNKRPIEFIRNSILDEAIMNVLQNGSSQTIRFSLFSPEPKDLEVNIVSFVFENVKIGAVAVFHDITRLVKLEQIRKDFVANVSHELKTPLTAISGYTETLLEGEVQEPAQIREFLRIIAKHAERLSLIVQDLLSLSKIESPDFQPSLKPVSLEQLVKKVTQIVSEMARKKLISITLNIPDTIEEIMADEPLLEQAVLNLLDNAVKYTNEGGSVTLTVQPMGKEIQVSIADTGIGIGSEHLPRIFERFYRVDRGRSREIGGTGLGLSIVKNIIEKHGGRVWAESELNKGSTFFFTLPRTNIS